MIAQASGSQSTAERTSSLRSGANGCRRRNVPARGIYSSFTLQSPLRSSNDIPASTLCEIGLDQITKLGGNLGALSEPQLKPAHHLVQQHPQPIGARSEERRVGKEGRSRWAPYH